MPADDINFELPEPNKYYQEALDLSLIIMPAKKTNEKSDIFKDA